MLIAVQQGAERSLPYLARKFSLLRFWQLPANMFTPDIGISDSGLYTGQCFHDSHYSFYFSVKPERTGFATVPCDGEDTVSAQLYAGTLLTKLLRELC